LSYFVLLCLTLSYFVLLCLTLSYFVSLCLTLSYFVLLCLTLSYFVLLCLIPSYSDKLCIDLSNFIIILVHPRNTWYLLTLTIKLDIVLIAAFQRFTGAIKTRNNRWQSTQYGKLHETNALLVLNYILMQSLDLNKQKECANAIKWMKIETIIFT
jgi:hypothetical protein